MITGGFTGFGGGGGGGGGAGTISLSGGNDACVVSPMASVVPAPALRFCTPP